MRVAVLLVAVVLGCAAADDKGSTPSGPNPAAKPPGTGWACFRDTLSSDVSSCARPDQCETLRKSTAAEFDRRGVPYSLSPCTTRSGVACVTFRTTTSAALVAVCTEMMSECQKAAEFYRSNPSDYRDVSTCSAW
ncbi:MAG: hypothetical protein JNL79_29250 [Myxococcales bacterium]|nr:hypothetical protein [Myxococcales bacterium]